MPRTRTGLASDDCPPTHGHSTDRRDWYCVAARRCDNRHSTPACNPVGGGTRPSRDRGWTCSGRTWPERFFPAFRCCLLPTWTYPVPVSLRYTPSRVFV